MSGVHARALATHRDYLKRARILDKKYYFVLEGETGPFVKRLMTQFGPARIVKTKYGARDLTDSTPVFTVDTSAFFEIGNDGMDLMNLAAVSLQRRRGDVWRG